MDAYTVYDKAVEAGFSLSDDDKASIDNEINTLKTYAGVYSMDLDEYIEAMFGKGCNEKNYRHYLEVSKLHDAYIESLTYTEDERNARYEQDTTEFDTVTYYSYAVKASDFETKSDSSTDSTEATTSTEPSEEAIAAAREAANAMVSDFKTDDENVSVMTERSKSEVTSSISEDAATGSTPRRSRARRSSLRRTTRSMFSSSRASMTTTTRPSTPAALHREGASDKEYKDGEKTSDERVSELEACPEGGFLRGEVPRVHQDLCGQHVFLHHHERRAPQHHAGSRPHLAVRFQPQGRRHEGIRR